MMRAMQLFSLMGVSIIALSAAGTMLAGATLAGVMLAADKVGEAEVEGVVMVVAVQLVMGPTKQVMYLSLVACVAEKPLMGP